MSIRIEVDLTNPGQFFACCGLLELADRLWPSAEGWFEGHEFYIKCDGDLRTLLSILVMDPPEEITRLDNELAVKPLIAPLRYSFDGGATTAITLDAWTTIRLVKGEPSVVSNAPWNFWSGQQTAYGIWFGLRAVLAAQLNCIEASDFDDLFSQRLFQKGRFGFDPGPAWNALDVGFSPNEQGIEVQSSAAVELLAAVGLQRFRPVVHQNRESFDYAAWTEPLPPSIAAAAMCGAVLKQTSARFRGCVVSRGQYAALGFSFPIREGLPRD
jgi:CRISPR-associated protein Csx14